MAAPPLANNFETQLADTTVITAANSDDGTPSAGAAFNTIIGSPTFSTSQAKSGTLSMRFDTTAVYAQTAVSWTGLGTITTSVWFRGYFYFTANPVSTSLQIIEARSNTAISSMLSLTTAGKLQTLNAALAGSTAGSVSVALNQWIRIEWRVLSSTTVGESEWWLYNTPEAPIGSFDEHVNNTGLVLGANTDANRWGATRSAGAANFVGFVDDVAVSGTEQLGPSGSIVYSANIAWLHV